MPTIVDRAYHRVVSLAGGAHAVAAAWVQSNPNSYAITNTQVLQHGSETPIVNLLQRGAVPRNAWFVASYPLTAACIGMLSLMGFKRVVYRNALGAAVNYDPTHMAIQGGNAFVCQFDKTSYAVENPPATQLGNMVGPAAIQQGAFPFAGAAINLINALQADDEAKRTFAIMLPFAIASVAHGGISVNANRRAAFHGQNVASVMVDSNWNLLYWGLNNNQAHTTFHGETNAIQVYQRANGGNALPDGGKLFTTLEPCAMCAGQLVHCAGGSQFEVVCGQEDRMVRQSALQAGGGTDGETGNIRRVTMTFSKAPAFTTQPSITAEMKSGQDRMYNSARAAAAAAGATTAPPQIPTTRYLEQSPAKFADMQKILEMSAAVWLPAPQRAQWRCDLQTFLQAVSAAVG